LTLLLHFFHRNRDRDVDAEDEEDVYERKKLERRLREKEAAYQEVRISQS
jgi:RNA-binding protein 25